VNLFVPSPEIEGRNAVDADNWARHKKTFYSFIFKRITKKKSNINSLIYFLFLQLQSSNFKPLVISTSLVIGT
jgi:hypothetical protein